MEFTPLSIPKLGAAVIHLTRGYHCLVDAADWPELSKWKWRAQTGSRKGYVYAARDLNGKTHLMHRQITGASGRTVHVDHDNHKTLDNRRSNLVIGASRNCHNRVKLSGCSSGYFGVTWHKASQKWQAQLKKNGKRIHAGLFTDEQEAARAADRKARELFERPRLNFP